MSADTILAEDIASLAAALRRRDNAREYLRGLKGNNTERAHLELALARDCVCEAAERLVENYADDMGVSVAEVGAEKTETCARCFQLFSVASAKYVPRGVGLCGSCWCDVEEEEASRERP